MFRRQGIIRGYRADFTLLFATIVVGIIRTRDKPASIAITARFGAMKRANRAVLPDESC